MHFTPPPLARHNIQRNLATRTTAVPRGASVQNHAERDETTTTMGEVLPSTDPYATREEPDPDRLLAKSTTPLMSGGASGIIRICILLGIAVFIIHGKSNAKPVATDTEYGGLRFPHEIKIAGSRQNVLGGGPTPFGALAVYVQMTPDQVTSPPSAEWAELDAYADRRHVESDGGFFHALGSLKLDKSILLQLDGRRDGDLVGELSIAEAAFNGNGAGAKVVEALIGDHGLAAGGWRTALHDMRPEKRACGVRLPRRRQARPRHGASHRITRPCRVSRRLYHAVSRLPGHVRGGDG